MADSLFNDDIDNNADRTALTEKWKAKTPEEVLAAKVESDLYIKTLTARMDDLTRDHLQLMEESKAKAQLQDLIDRLEARGQGQEQVPQNQSGNADQQPSFKPEDIEKIVQQKISEADLEKTRANNFRSIQAKLKEVLGDNAQEILKQRREELGLAKEFADDLARNHPAVFMKTFGLEVQAQDPFRAPPRSNVRPATFGHKEVVRDWNYYQELKKNDPRAYLDPKIAVQMHDDAIALGDRFGMPED